MFRVIIAGGRDFQDYNLLCNTMDNLLINIQDDIAIISGKARGADTLGECYARDHGYTIYEFPANWNKYGRAAGYIRNEEMARNADALVAFWDGKSRGTKNMIETAYHYQLNVRVKQYNNF